MKKTLVILAAGMGSRFGERIKQLEPLGPNGELIIDYSVNYAIEAGFSSVVFIIRKDLDLLFKNMIGNRISKIIDTKYVYQQIDDIPDDFSRFSGRTKPWGTAQALYCCREQLSGNFAVINADDYYDKGAFIRLGKFPDNSDDDGCSIGFILKNTLSGNGTVNRGICKTDDNGYLKSVVETKNIARNNDGSITGTVSGETVQLDENEIVSMNMWGFSEKFLTALSKNLSSFLAELSDNDMRSELTIADVVDREIKNQSIKIKNISTTGAWFGITYLQDVDEVKNKLTGLY